MAVIPKIVLKLMKTLAFKNNGVVEKRRPNIQEDGGDEKEVREEEEKEEGEEDDNDYEVE